MSILQTLQKRLGFVQPEFAFKTDSEIVTDLLAKMSSESKDVLRNTPFGKLISFHFTTGRAIRNEYKLWDPLNPYLNGRHPDDVSHYVIEELWRKLQPPSIRRPQTATARKTLSQPMIQYTTPTGRIVTMPINDGTALRAIHGSGDRTPPSSEPVECQACQGYGRTT